MSVIVSVCDCWWGHALNTLSPVSQFPVNSQEQTAIARINTMIMAIIFLLYVAHKEEWNTVVIIVIIVSYKLVWYVFFFFFLTTRELLFIRKFQLFTIIFNFLNFCLKIVSRKKNILFHIFRISFLRHARELQFAQLLWLREYLDWF